MFSKYSRYLKIHEYCKNANPLQYYRQSSKDAHWYTQAVVSAEVWPAVVTAESAVVTAQLLAHNRYI